MLRSLARHLTNFLAPRPVAGPEVLRAIQEKQIQGGPFSTTLTDTIAEAALAVQHHLSQQPFPEQLLGAAAMASGHIVEMQTGEGKTLTAVLAAAFYARQGIPVHILTANDYLARRDAEWMGPAYRALGLSTAYLQQGFSPSQRRQAYAADVLYATPNEIGFDFLRDSLALSSEEIVQGPFGIALIDEADSILIDEARIPLVIAGGEAPPRELVLQLAELAARLAPGIHYLLDEHARNVLLTDQGAAFVERALGHPNLYDDPALFTAIHDALHARALLKANVDYIVRDGAIHIIDEFKGRIADSRRWPAGLQTALEAKEGLELRTQGRVLGSITLQSLVKLYQGICGMTGTIATQAEEIRKVYGLEVITIPTHRPVIRIDHPDNIAATGLERDHRVIEEIATHHVRGRPILVGTASVADSERLSALLTQRAIPHHVLNARNDAAEARIIAQAGQPGAVTISTNMAGRGTDIQLGPGVSDLGGLYVIGTCRHEARRIDNQLRGRAGRQGDPGESRFFLALDDDLLGRFGIAHALRATPDPAAAVSHIQRVIEGENLEIRKTLIKYDAVTELHRRAVHDLRSELLTGDRPCANPRLALLKIDELWSDYLGAVQELKSGVHWLSFGGQDPLHSFLGSARQIFDEIRAEMDAAIDNPDECGIPDTYQRGATWTFVTTDQPLGDLNQRIARGLMNKIRALFSPPR